MKKNILICALIIFMTLGVAQGAFAKEPATPEITLNAAIEKAIKNSELVKKAEVDIERTEALRDEAADQLDFIPTGGSGYNPQLEATWASMLQADLTWRMSKKNYNARLDGIALDVCQLYWDILKLQEKVEAKKVAVEKARLELQKSRAAYQVGLVGKLDRGASTGGSFTGLQQAEAAMVKAEGDLAATQNELDQAYTKFNQLVGLWPEDRPVLVDSLEFHPVEINNLETEVNRALEKSPSVWLAEQGVELQKYVHDLMWATGQYRPYDAREAEKEQAELDAINAREATKLLVRDLYYTLKTLEESYKSAEQGVAVAEEALRVSKLMYEVGMATKADVISAESTLADAKLTLKNLAAAHSYTKLVFQKPWAPMYSTLSGTSGTSVDVTGSSTESSTQSTSF